MQHERPVPVNEWSQRFAACQVPAGRVTLVWFPPNAVLAPHMHERPTLAVILDGGFELELPGTAHAARPVACGVGTVLAQPAGQLHANHIGGMGAHGVVIQPDTSSDALPAGCLGLLESVHHFRDGPIALAARGVARELSAPDDLTPLAIEALVLEMLAEAAPAGEAGARRSADLPGWLTAATDFAHSAFRERVRVSDIAHAVGVHPAHLASVFRRAHRMPLGTYMRRLRVDWAATQLAHTDVSIPAIAAGAGFADQAHLTRWFRRVMRVTPGRYRRDRRWRAAGRTAPAAAQS